MDRQCNPDPVGRFAKDKASRDNNGGCRLRYRSPRDRHFQFAEAMRLTARHSRSHFTFKLFERHRPSSKSQAVIWNFCGGWSLRFGTFTCNHFNPLKSNSAFVFVASRFSINFSIASIGGSAAMVLRRFCTRSHSSGWYNKSSRRVAESNG